MWRALFLAIGAYCCLLGVESLALDEVVLKPKTEDGKVVGESRRIEPPEWAPWSLMAGGAVVALYSFSIPRRVGG